MNRYASTYRSPSSASVQPRAPMSGGTGSYGTLSRRAQPGLNSATPFGYPANTPQGVMSRVTKPHTGVLNSLRPFAQPQPPRVTKPSTAVRPRPFTRPPVPRVVKPSTAMLPWSFIQRSPPDYQQMLNQKMQQPYPYYDQLQQLNIPGMG